MLDLDGRRFSTCVAALDFGILGYVIVGRLPRRVGTLGLRVEIRPDRERCGICITRPTCTSMSTEQARHAHRHFH